jgi:hypothetical protein
LCIDLVVPIEAPAFCGKRDSLAGQCLCSGDWPEFDECNSSGSQGPLSPHFLLPDAPVLFHKAMQIASLVDGSSALLIASQNKHPSGNEWQWKVISGCSIEADKDP